MTVQSVPPLPAQLRLAALADGFLTTQLLYVAAKLRLADVLAAGPRSGPEVAAAVNADADVITRILRGLSLDDVVVEHADGRFSLGALGEYLRDGVPGSQRGPILMRGAVYFPVARGLLGAATEGTAAFEEAYGQPFSIPEQRRGTRCAVSGVDGRPVRARGRGCRRRLRSVRVRRLVDVGAGTGALTRAALHAVPGLTATLVDRASMLDRARRELEAAGLSDRCTFLAGDFFTSLPTGGDAYLLSLFPSVFAAGAAGVERSEAILRRRALRGRRSR